MNSLTRKGTKEVVLINIRQEAIGVEGDFLSLCTHSHSQGLSSQERNASQVNLAAADRTIYVVQYEPVVRWNIEGTYRIIVAKSQGWEWLDQTAVKTVRAPDRTARFGALWPNG